MRMLRMPRNISRLRQQRLLVVHLLVIGMRSEGGLFRKMQMVCPFAVCLDEARVEV